MPTIYVPPVTPVVIPPLPPSQIGPPNRQHWATDLEQFAVDQLVKSHDDALWSYGEYMMYVLLWTVRDFQLGLVDRCSTCYLTLGKIAETYGQASQERCPDCLGTSFSGGYRAQIVRPTIFEEVTLQDHVDVARGATVTGQTALQTVNNFTFHNGDFVLRGDGSRWRVQVPDQGVAADGFGARLPPVPSNYAWTGTIAIREDVSSVAYITGPDTAGLIELLAVTNIKRPLDFSDIEVIRGPL